MINDKTTKKIRTREMEEKIIERFTVIIKMPLFQEYSEYALS
jgi:hypothetical protein